MPEVPEAELEAQIGQWRGYVRRHRAISSNDVDELEHHLRDQVTDLRESGLAQDEAFLVAVKRMGRLDEVSREFAREHSDRLWKQLVLTPGAEDGQRAAGRRELRVVLTLAFAAAVAIKIPALVSGGMDSDPSLYLRNLSLFVLPFLAAYLAWKRGMRPRRAAAMLLPPFLVGGLLVNLYPFEPGGSTEALAWIGLPIALWFVVGVAYAGGEWRAHRPRMDFIRFTGEWAVYYTLLAIGGGILMGLTAAGFQAIGQDIETAISEWILPCGAMGAVLVAAWLVEAKQGVVENIAPVLTAVFTPLATLMLLAYLVAILGSGAADDVDRMLLILADLILVLVFGLLLYAISARDPLAPAGAFDRLQLLMVCSAIVVDALMLAAMLGRIAEFGTSPNKLAALGLNLILLTNLIWSARLSLAFLRGGSSTRLERWQTAYLPVFAAWAAIVVVIFPPAFGWA